MRILLLGLSLMIGVGAFDASPVRAQTPDEIPPPPGAVPPPPVAVAPSDPNAPPPVVVVGAPPPAYELPPPPSAYGTGLIYDQNGMVIARPALLPEGIQPRRGFALSLGQGLGFTLGAVGDGGAVDFNFGLGGYVAPSFALFWRVVLAAGVSDFRPGVVIGMLIAGQSWLSERWMFGYGAGIGAVDSGRVGSGDGTRFVFQGRLGYAFSHWSRHSLLMVLNAHGGAAEDQLIAMMTVSFEWQMH